MRKSILSILFLFTSLILLSQKKDLKQTLYKLEDRIISGDFNALREISKYIDDTTFVQEFLGYHNYPNTVRGVTMRVIEENCLFTEDELRIDSTLTTIRFLDILSNGRVKFDEITGMFLMTDLNHRKTDYILKELSEHDLKRIDTTLIKAPYPEWYYESQIDGFLLTKNPEVLMQIASAWYKKRSRFNTYYFRNEEFLELMKKLTNIEVGVPDEKDKTTFLYESDYYAIARLNYLIYWTNHYKDYKWNNDKKYFENLKEIGGKKSKEEILFSLLSSEDDSLAIDAFAQLGEFDPVRVASLADDYEKGTGKRNFVLPTFPFRFLKQMTLLTEYCRKNGIKYKAENWLLDSLIKLKTKLLYYERYRLENNIINKLTVNEVTVVEYFGLVYGGNWDLSYSMGRILDKHSSKNWKELCSNKNGLEYFLKKSALFDRLGIIGICNKYLRKFENCSSMVIDDIKEIARNTSDPDIKQQANEAVSKYSLPIERKLEEFKSWEGSNSKYGVNDLTGQYRTIKKSTRKDDDKENEIQKLIGGIRYDQLGEAIRLLQPDTVFDAYSRFHFIESDFGFDINVWDSNAVDEFLKVFNSKPEKQVYEHYLKKMRLDCFDAMGNLNFPGIMEILKYDVVDAFVGGGGGRREKGVYLVIKLLELKFNTTLGFPKKLCSWQGVWACYNDDRARAWMNYLEQKKLVTVKTEPPSISNND